MPDRAPSPAMDDARWRRVRTLFDAASELPAGERAGFLARECAGDPALHAEVAALVNADERAAERLGHAVREAAGDAARHAVSVGQDGGRTWEGRRIGPWRIVRQLGQGGMGLVYLAERVDGAFTQQVALKLIRRGLDSDRILQRFEGERQILARLEHPNIARLVDGGLTSDGTPWFAMELVEGDPIDRYCAARELGVEARLRLFAEVCRAVAFAHSRLVVHRDLKPDNILVTQRGEVRLLDFGIAKVIGDAPAGETLTRTGMRVMTPGYASPEQVRGEPVGTATDVYSLGVILYELLTGERPHDLSGRTLAEVQRIVSEEAPARPSTRVGDTGRLRRQLRGDLDVICLKALHKEPERRFASVEALHADIVRHLDGRPVLARPDTVLYRARKFVSRHRVGVTGAVAGSALLVTLTAVYLVRLAAERDHARSEAAKAGAIAGFLQGLFAVSDPSASRGASVTARELLDAGAARIGQDLASAPEVQASMMRLIGEVYGALGLADKAIPLLEGALERHRALYGDLHAETAASALALGMRRQDLGDLAGAEPLLREAVATRTALHGTPDEGVIEAQRHLAYWEESNGDDAEAERLLREALAQARRLFPPDDERVVGTVVRLGGLLRRTGRFGEAEPLLREGLAAQRRILGDTHPGVTSSIRNLASLRRDQGDLVEAETLYLEALALRRALYGDSHPDVANVLNSYAILLAAKGDRAGAIRIQHELLAIWERIYDGPHPSIAAAYNNLGDLERESGRAAASVPLYRRCIALQDVVLPGGHPNRAYPQIGLGRALRELGRHAEADRAFRRALEIRRAALPRGHHRIVEVLELLAALHEEAGASAEAERYRVLIGEERDG
jgi:eukaryotic-like serine/threonine-protein kinase